MVLGKTRFGGFFFVPCRSELAPGGVSTMDVNDNACCLEERAALESIAGNRSRSHNGHMRFVAEWSIAYTRSLACPLFMLHQDAYSGSIN